MGLVYAWSPGPSRKILLLTSFLFIVTLFFTWDEFQHARVIRLNKDSGVQIEHMVSNTMQQAKRCPLDIKYLKHDRYRLRSDNIVFHRQCIKARHTLDMNRDSVTDVDEDIFGQNQALNLSQECHEWDPMPCDPIHLDVPPPFPIRHYPELLFGVATSFDRLVDSLPQLAHWLSNSGARLVAVVVDAAKHLDQFHRLKAFYSDHGVDLIIAESFGDGVTVNEQHFTIIRDLLRHATPETKWVGIIDDDTFFPSLYPLAEILATQDHNIPAYLGGLSDSLEAIQIHGLMAYGGAGAFLSMPLVRELEPHIETCLRQSSTQQGDALLKNCIYGQTKARLTTMPGLNQLDIIGDPSGFYESGRYPLSLHHWKTWHSAPVDQMAKSSDFCGGCFLQRWRFGEDTVLANGYSVAQYKRGISHTDLNRTEATWEHTHLFDWSLGPLRRRNDERVKKSFRLIDAEKVGKSLRQVYVHRGRDTPDEVLELWWQW